MASESFKSLWTNYAIVGLFVFSLFAFVIIFEGNNNVQNGILTNPIINSSYNNLNSTLSGFQTTTNNTKNNFEKGTPTVGIGELVFNTLFSGGRILNGMIIAIFNILIILPAQFLGLSAAIFGVLFSILLVSIMLLFWRLIKSGQ